MSYKHRLSPRSTCTSGSKQGGGRDLGARARGASQVVCVDPGGDNGCGVQVPDASKVLKREGQRELGQAKRGAACTKIGPLESQLMCV